MNHKQLQVNPVASQIQPVEESSVLRRGLELVEHSGVTALVPAALIINDDNLLIVEDAAFCIDWDRESSYWNGNQTRAIAIHRFSLDGTTYLSSTPFKLGPNDGSILDRKFVIFEGHLIVSELYQRRLDSFSVGSFHRAEQIFSLNGQFITLLTSDPVLRALYKHENLNSKSVAVTHERYGAAGAIASKPFITLHPSQRERNSIPSLCERKERDFPFAIGREVLLQAIRKPTDSSVLLTALQDSHLELYRQLLYPDGTFWDISSRGDVAASRGDLRLDYEGEFYPGYWDPESDLDGVLLVAEPERYFFGDHIEGDTEVLISCMKESETSRPEWFFYFWIEDDEIASHEFLTPHLEIENLNREGKVKYTFRDIVLDSVIHHGVLYLICDEVYSKTSSIMMFDVRAGNISTVFPQVPCEMRILQPNFRKSSLQFSSTIHVQYPHAEYPSASDDEDG